MNLTPGISVAMLVRNPPLDRMAALIDLLQPVVCEFVVVDTGSDDDVKNVMRSWRGVRVIEKEWEDDFSAARNYGVFDCRYRWTFIIDPDELPSFELLKFLERLNDPDFVVVEPGFLVWTRNYWGGELGREEEYHWHLRIFQTGRGQFYRRVHELVAIDGVTEDRTRGSVIPKLPRSQHLIHSKAADEIEAADRLYARLGEISR